MKRRLDWDWERFKTVVVTIVIIIIATLDRADSPPSQ